jgi:hypothetical protein
MAAHPDLDQLAATVSAWRTESDAGFVAAAEVGAQDLIERLRDQVPDGDPTVIGAALLDAAGCVASLFDLGADPDLVVNILGTAGLEFYSGTVSDVAV